MTDKGDLEAAQNRIRELEDQVRDLKNAKASAQTASETGDPPAKVNVEEPPVEAPAIDAPAVQAAPVGSDDDEATDTVFEALWKRVTEAWDDDKTHAAILQHAITAQMMPELAGRYRKLKDDPEKGPRAQKKIDGIVIAATQMLMSTKSPPRTKTPWQWTAAAAIVFLIVITYLLYALILRHR